MQSDPAAAGAPAHPLAELSLAEEVPFSVVHADGDSESEGEGLSGQAAFSSVLTVMAGTVKHPVSIDQIRTSPTITRDGTHTTQWPSHSSSQGSVMSSSSSSAGDRILAARSGLSHQRTTPPQAVTMASTRPSHVSLIDGNRDDSLFSSSTVSSSSLSSLVSPAAPSISSVLSSVLSLLSPPPSAGWMNEAAASSQSQRTVPGPAPQTTATLSPAGSQGWTASLTTTQPTTHSVIGLTAVLTPGLLNITTRPPHFPSKTSIEKSNKVTKHSPADKIHGVSETYIRSASTKVIETPAASTYASYSTLLNILYRPTQTWSRGMSSVSANDLEISTSFPINQRQQGALQNPTSALLSAHPKGYSVASCVTQQMLKQMTYVEKESKTAASSPTFVHKSAGDAILSPLSPHVVNPTVSPAVTLRSTPSFFTVSSQTPPAKTPPSETATPIRSGMASSEHASSPGDLLMAAGHGSSRVSAININYNQGEIAEAELQSVSALAHLSNSLSLRQPRPESTTGPVLSSIARTGTASSTSESDSLHLPSNGVINVQEFDTQTWSREGITQEPAGRSMPKMIFPSNSKTMSLSGSALPANYKTTSESLSRPTPPTFRLPSFLSHNNTEHNAGLSASSEVNFADQAKASLSSHTTSSQRLFQTRSLLTFPRKLYTTSVLTLPPDKSHQTVSLAESKRALQSIPSTLEVEINAGNSKASSASDAHVTYGEMLAESFHRSAAETSVSPLFDGNEESSLIRDTASNKRAVPSGQFTTHFPSFMTTKDFFVLNKRSEGPEMLFSAVPFDAASETLKSLSHKEDGTLMGRYERSTPSSWSEITLTARTNSTSRSPASITSVRGDKSHFYLDAQTSIPSMASSSATTSSSDGENSSEIFSAIFSFGKNIMAPYTKWKTSKPLSFQSTASELENTSIGSDRANSNFQADGPSYEHLNLEDGQERNVHILNLTDPTVVASDPYPLYLTVGEHPSLTYVKGTSGDKEQSLNVSPANLRSAADATVQQAATVDTAAPSARGSEHFLPLPHTTADSVASSQASSLELMYKSKPSPPLADADSLESAFDIAVTLSDNPTFSFFGSDKNTTGSKLRGLTLPTELVPLSSSFHTSPSSSETSPLSYGGIKSSQLPSLHMKPPASKASTSSLSLSASSTMYAGTASSSVSMRATFPSLSPSLALSLDSEEVTETFVVLTETGTELTAGTSRAVALSFPKEKVASLAPSQSVRITLSAGPTERMSQVSPLPPRQDTTTASVKLTTTTAASTTKTKNPTTTTPSPGLTTASTQSTTASTPQPTPVTRRTTTTTTIRTQTSRRTFTPPVPRTSSPRGTTTIFNSPFTTTTEAPPQQCNITERLWVKTGKQYFCHNLKKKSEVVLFL